MSEPWTKERHEAAKELIANPCCIDELVDSLADALAEIERLQAEVKSCHSTMICFRAEFVAVERLLQARVAELLTDLMVELCEVCPEGEPRAGWYDTMARSSAKDAGDELVALGLWERHPEGYGRRWFYRPIKNPCSATIQGEVKP